MNQRQTPSFGLKIGLVLVLSLFLAGCTKPSVGGGTLPNQPSNTDVLEQTQTMDQSELDQTATSASESVTENAQSVVQSNKPMMKKLPDFPPNSAQQATIKTSKGDIVIELYRDKAPLTTINFITLASSGFYDGILFHRIIPGFMAQVGDPLTKDASQKSRWGSGGPGYVIADEFGEGLIHDKAGVVSMANAGPNSGGSQFFITHEETPWLDGKHAVFGQVTAGMDVVMQLEIGDAITGIELQ